jgi:hypothetical protein
MAQCGGSRHRNMMPAIEVEADGRWMRPAAPRLSDAQENGMALRVARRLFRLWLVASVLWIGGVGITWPWGLQWTPIGHEVDRLNSYEVDRLNSQATKIEVQSPDGMIHQFPVGTAGEVIDRAMKE